MMKKVLFSLLLAIACLPVFAQIDAAPIIRTIEEMRCTPFTWDITGETYDHDTVIMVNDPAAHHDTVYILNLTVNPDGIIRDTVEATAKCVYIWRDSLVWRESGLVSATVSATSGCDSIHYINLTITGGYDTSIAAVSACDKYMSAWGELFTQDTIIDTSYITNEGCHRRDSLALTINHSFLGDLEIVDGDCSYEWRGRTILDDKIHYDTMPTVGRCDSILRIKVNMSFHIDTTYDTLVCDRWAAPWDTAHPYTTPGAKVHNDTNSHGCVTTTTVNLAVNYSFTDTAWARANTQMATIGCYKQWGSQVLNTVSPDTVLATLKDINKCDSIAAIRIVALTYQEYVDSSVTPCNHPFKWRPYTGALFTLTNNGTYNDTNVVGTGATACTTYYSLNLTFTDSIATNQVKVRPVRCEYDSIKIGSVRYSFRIENGDTITRKFTGSNNNPSISVINKDSIFVYNTSTQCTTFHRYKLNIVAPQESTTNTTAKACDKYNYTLVNNMEFRRSVDTTIISSKRPSKATYPGNNPHQPNDCTDKSYHLNLTVHYSDSIRTDTTACDRYTWFFNDTTYTRNINISRKSSDTTEYGCSVYGTLNLTINRTPESHISGEWMLEPGANTTLQAVSAESGLEYTWYKNGVEQDGHPETFTVTDEYDHENIDIMLTASNGNGCPDSNWVTITFANIGIDEADAFDVNIYPNPATRIVNLRTAEAISTVSVYNAIGQQVMLRQGNGNTMQIDLYTLANGHYTMRIRTVEGHEAVRKFIVSK